MAVTKQGTLDLGMRRRRTPGDPKRVVELRGLRYVDVRCAKCRREFRIPRLPSDRTDAQAEGLLCALCAAKRDASVSLALTKKDLDNNPLLPFAK
jgi:hypothetical protein